MNNLTIQISNFGKLDDQLFGLKWLIKKTKSNNSLLIINSHT